MSDTPGMLIDKEAEAARAIADAIHGVYMVGMRVNVPPVTVARLMIVDAAIQMYAHNKHGDIPLLVVDALKRAGGQ